MSLSLIPKALRALAWCFAWLCLSDSPSRAQGIINGDFEQYDQVNQFLPGWHVYIKVLTVDFVKKDFGATVNAVQGSLIEFRHFVPSQPYISMEPTDISPNGLGKGSYFLWGEGFTSDGTWFIEQRVMVPHDVQSLQWRSYLRQEVFVDGQPLALFKRQTVDRAVGEYWADVGHLAGHEITLAFTIANGGGFDDVRFSSEPVPEPTVLGALAMASAAILVRRNKKGRTRGCGL